MIDKTGEMPSLRDVVEARAAVRRSMVWDIMKLPPELAVQLPNIDRCLGVLEAVLQASTK